MKTRFSTIVGLTAGLLVGVTATVQAQFNYETHDGKVLITKYTGPGGDVVIPDTIEGKPVTSVLYWAFADSTDLTSVVIPDSVISIGYSTFQDCTGLTRVTIGNGVTRIGDWAFWGCTGLPDIAIPDSVTSLGYGAFSECISLTNITIPDSVASIGDYTFYGCRGLTSITIPDSVTSIGEWAFSECISLTGITIPDSVTSIADGAFRDCTSLSSVVIPDSVTSIGAGAFSECISLTSITIPDSVISIGDSAFSGCTSLSSITIPNSVTSIGGGAFSGCTGLTSIVIPDSVTWIGDGAFSRCSSLTNVTIPDNVTSIESWTFERCTSLTSVSIGNSVTTIGGWVFSGCTSLTGIVIPDSVTWIGGGAFSGCTSLTSIDVDALNPVYSSFDGALLNETGTVLMLCPQGKSSITIPDSVTDIGDWAFSGCTGLTSVTIGKGLRSITAELFASCTKLASISISALNDANSSFDGVVFNKDRTVLILCPRGRSTIIIPAGVTQIAVDALEYCWGLQAVYFYGDAPPLSSSDFRNTMATLFYLPGTAGWETNMAGRPTVAWNGLFGAQSLKLLAGLTITGEIGKVYSIEYVTDLTDPVESDWRCLEYLQLPASPYLWADKSAPATGKRFYRAVAMEAPENMVFIPPGTFRMGSPQTDVTISRGYWMGKYEVTQGEYESVVGENPSRFNGIRQVWDEESQTEIDVDYTDPTRPVEQVSWNDAVAYCAALTERERLAGRIAPNCVYRLPTEAEWEYACRAWTSTRFSYGDDIGYTKLTNYAWYSGNSGGQTHPVGQKLPNPRGLHDMHGNVFEWCQDWWAYNLPGGIALDPQGPAVPSPDWGSPRVIRGGGWYFWRDWDEWDSVWYCRSAGRYDIYNPDYRGHDIGFRAVLAPGQ